MIITNDIFRYLTNLLYFLRKMQCLLSVNPITKAVKRNAICTKMKFYHMMIPVVNVPMEPHSMVLFVLMNQDVHVKSMEI